MHDVATFSKPRRVDSRSAAHIQHPCRCRRKVPPEHLLNSEKFELAESRADAILFPNGLVVSKRSRIVRSCNQRYERALTASKTVPKVPG